VIETAATNLHPRFYDKKADKHHIWQFEACRGDRTCGKKEVSPLSWFIDMKSADVVRPLLLLFSLSFLR
jgi:hypothetical protein